MRMSANARESLRVKILKHTSKRVQDSKSHFLNLQHISVGDVVTYECLEEVRKQNKNSFLLPCIFKRTKFSTMFL